MEKIDDTPKGMDTLHQMAHPKSPETPAPVCGMSKDNNQTLVKLDPKIKFDFFKRNKNFCSVPWNLLYVWTNGGIQTCTQGLENFGNLHDLDHEDVLKNPDLGQIKSRMVQDMPNQNCNNCLRLENTGDGVNQYGFIRNMYNEKFIDQNVDYTDQNDFVLSAVDLHWSSICDLKCITCWDKQSSSIAVEQGRPIQHTKTETALRLIETIVKKQHSLKEVYLSGGEPTLIKYNLNLLSRLTKRPDLLIRINSNMMWDQDNAIVQEVLKFPNVMFTCSADNLYQKFEYIRRGAVWKKFVDNLEFLCAHNNVNIRINTVFFVLTALDLIDIIDYFNQNHNIDNFTINQCAMGHTYLRPRNLPEHVKQLVRNKLEIGKSRYAHDLNLIGSFNNCLAEMDQPASESYVEYLNHIDGLAGSNHKLLFPEIL